MADIDAGDVTFRFLGDVSDLEAAAAKIDVALNKNATTAKKAADETDKALKQTTGAVIELTKAEKKFAEELKAQNVVLQARSEALGITVAEVKRFDAIQTKAAETAKAAAASTSAASKKAAEAVRAAAEKKAIAEEMAAARITAATAKAAAAASASAAKRAAAEEAAAAKTAAAVSRASDAAARAATKTAAAATKTAAASVKTAKSIRVTSNASARGIQAVAIQIPDIGQQLIAGQSPFMIMVQQGGQIVQQFAMIPGLLTTIVTAIASVALPVTVVVAAVSSLASALQESRLEMESVRAAIDGTNEALDPSKVMRARVEWRKFERVLLDARVALLLETGALEALDIQQIAAIENARKAARAMLLVTGIRLAMLEVSRQTLELATRSGKLNVRDQLAAEARLSTLREQVPLAKANIATLKEEVNAKIESINQTFNEIAAIRAVDEAAKKSAKERVGGTSDRESALASLDRIIAKGALAEVDAAEAINVAFRARIAQINELERASEDSAKAKAARDAAEFIRTKAQDKLAKQVAKNKGFMDDMARMASFKLADFTRSMQIKVLSGEEEIIASNDRRMARITDLQAGAMSWAETEEEAQAIALAANEARIASIDKMESDLAERRAERNAEIVDAVFATAEKSLQALSLLAQESQQKASDNINRLQKRLADGEETLTDTQKEAIRARIEIQEEALTDAFNADKKAKLGQIAMATSLGIIQAFAQLGPLAGAIAAAGIGILGGVQASIVASQEPPTFASGGFLDNLPTTGATVTLHDAEAVLSRQGRDAFGDDAIRAANNGSLGGMPTRSVTVYKHKSFDFFMQDHLRKDSFLARTVRGGTRVGHRQRGRSG